MQISLVTLFLSTRALVTILHRLLFFMGTCGVLNSLCVCVFCCAEGSDGKVSEGGGGEDAEGHHTVLFPRGHQLGSSD